jgi:hypothetical protein
LGHVSYSVSTTTANGIDSLTIIPSVATSLSDENGNSLPFTIANGSISVGAVPEPWALTQATIAAALIGLGYCCRRYKFAVT